MTNKSETKTTVTKKQTDMQINTPSELIPVIYADRVINVAFGPGVSKLSLAMEASTGVFTPTATLILPTTSLLEAMSAVLNAFQGNDDVKNGILKGLDAFKEQINSQYK
jgi:hypothetical protein